MNTSEIENIFEKPILELPFNHQLAYMYYLSVRLFPIYSVFSETEKWGKPEVYKAAIKILKSIIIERRTPDSEELKIVTELNENTPDTEAFGSILSSAALDSCVIILETFDAIIEKDSETIASLASLPFNAISMYVEELNGVDPNYKNYDAFVFAHPLMEEEMEYQRQLFQLLSETDEIKELFFAENKNLKKSSFSENLKLFEVMSI